MKQVDIAVKLADFTKQVDEMKLPDEFQGTDKSNERNAMLHDLSVQLGRFVVVSALASKTKKDHDNCKKNIDDCLANLQDYEDVTSGNTFTYTDGSVFNLRKRRTAESFSLSVKDFELELNKLGVDPMLIAKAKANAQKTKPGNLYYEVEARL